MKKLDKAQQDASEVEKNVDALQSQRIALEQSVSQVQIDMTRLEEERVALEANPPVAPIIINATFLNRNRVYGEQ